MRLLRNTFIVLAALVLVRPLATAADADPPRPDPKDSQAEQPWQPFFKTDTAFPRLDNPQTWLGFQTQAMTPYASFQPFSSTASTSPTGAARYGNPYGNPYGNDAQAQLANYLAAQQQWQMYKYWLNSQNRMTGPRSQLPGVGASSGGDTPTAGACINAHNNAMLGLIPGNPFSSCFVRGTLVSSGSGSLKPIETIQVGQRVGSAETSQPIDTANWRQVELRAVKRDISTATIVLLRPADWLQSHQAKVGEEIAIDLPGCGFTGTAIVTAIRPCPTIEPEPGAIVTGTIRHSSAAVVNLRIDGLNEPIGTTANHQFWSEDRNDFVRADALVKGERLRGRTETARVLGVMPRTGSEAVYNLEASGGKFSVSRMELVVRDAGTSR